jgi:hypothetical protein
MLTQVRWYGWGSVTPTEKGYVVRWSREGCEINSIRTGHHKQVRQDTRLYTRAPSLADAISSPVPRWGESLAGA